MFQSARKRIEAMLEVVDDMLAGAPEPDVAPHPHRRPAQVRVTRRRGEVAARPMQCLCPVRTGSPSAADGPRHAHLG